MKEQFVEINFRSKTRIIIRQAIEIITDMKAQGYTLTLRQLYYQFVAKGYLENTPQNYDKLGRIVDDARKAGLIDWNAIEDRTRFLRRIPTYSGVPQFIDRTRHNYAEDLWRDQDAYCEVWIEKDALLGVIERPCLEYRVPYFACRGYPSSSELYEAGKRLRRKVDVGKEVFIFYLGDHDPDGIFMPKSNDDWLRTYGRHGGFNVERIALNMDQVEAYDPPPNVAKDTSSRYGDYVNEFGEESWELDALEPSVIDELIRDNIEKLIDFERWTPNVAREHANEQLYERIGVNLETIKHRMDWA